MLPVVLRCGVQGERADGSTVGGPRSGLFGRLTVSAEGLAWTNRSGRGFELPWSDVRSLDYLGGPFSWSVLAEGWRTLVLRPSNWQWNPANGLFVQSLREAGLVVHDGAPAWRGRLLALPPGVEPDWGPAA